MLVEISMLLAGNCCSRGWESHSNSSFEYSAKGMNTRTTPRKARIRRVRSSSKCEISVPTSSGSCSAGISAGRGGGVAVECDFEPAPDAGRWPRASAAPIVLARTLGSRGIVLEFGVRRRAGACAGCCRRQLLRCGRRVLIIVVHGLLEATHRVAQIMADIAELLGAEDKCHDQQHYGPVPDT